jgi:hypothetical protein
MGSGHEHVEVPRKRRAHHIPLTRSHREPQHLLTSPQRKDPR